MRRFVADWSKNSTLLAIIRDKETGKFKIHRFLYSNAYDYNHKTHSDYIK